MSGRFQQAVSQRFFMMMLILIYFEFIYEMKAFKLEDCYNDAFKV